ncbi:hypothetical protein [Niabella aurantiaca]|uniref:hypothetical protein n=1 Tax=Niabella aurantiaca TaxID=379900 RepID=UPI000382B0C5|nr:hypothetical protein [Niabella aurantiaca]
MLYGILLILLGILAVPSLVLSRKPEAKALLDKITPYQGWIGIVFCIWGLWGIISALLHIGWLSIVPVTWLLWLATAGVTAALGFILGYGLIQQYALSKNKEASEKGQRLLEKLRPQQGRLGIAAIVIGILSIIAAIVWRMPVA